VSNREAVYRARWILPVSSEPLSEGAVRVTADGLIDAVGAAKEVPVDGARVFELGDAIILPGLVNVHAHPELTCLRGRLEDLEFTRWIEMLTELKYDVLSAEALRVSTWLGIAEAVASGVTCVAAPDDAGFLMRAMVESGLRGRVYREVFGPSPDQADEALAEIVAKVEAARPLQNDRVEVGISPHAPYTVSASLFGKLAEYALTEGLPVCIHAAESEAEESFVRRGTGPFAERLRARKIEVRPNSLSPISWLSGTGILATRPLLVHCVRADSSDIACIADHGASIAHCPISNAKLGHGVAPLADFMEANIAVGLGSDSVASNNRMDILEEGRFAALLQRSVRRDATVVSPRDLLRLATLEGARALGLGDGIGSLQPGKRADMAAVRVDLPRSMPTRDPVTALFHSASAADVILTVVGGQVLYRDGEFTTIDWTALADDVQTKRFGAE